MRTVPQPVADFLKSRRIAVAGVSRTNGVGNAILRKLRGSGYDVVPVNPNASELEGSVCYPDLRSVPGELDAVIFASHPRFGTDGGAAMRRTRRPGHLVPPLVRRGQRLRGGAPRMPGAQRRGDRGRLSTHVLRARRSRSSVHVLVAAPTRARSALNAAAADFATARIMAAMAKVSKSRSPAQSKRFARAASGPSAPSPKAFLRFYHSAELRERTLAALDALERSRDATVHGAALADVVVELTNSGLDYYFAKPLELAKPGFIVQQSANLGLAGAQRIMGSVIRNILGRMDKPQLLSVCGSIRRLMR